MNILITGSNGFVGQHLIKALSNTESTIFAFDLASNESPTDSAANTVFIEGNIITGRGFENVPWSNLDVVIHLAAAGVKAKSRNWQSCLNVNILGTQKLLYKLAELPTSPLFLFTRSFYENHLGENSPFKDNPYVVTKDIASKLIRLWAQEDSSRRIIEGTIFQAYGPGDATENVLSYASFKLKNDELATFGNGSIQRDWIYIDDLVQAIITSLYYALNKDQLHQNYFTFDYGTGKLTSLQQVLNILLNISNKNSELLEFDESKSRGDDLLCDFAKKLVPGWSNNSSLPTALEKMYHSFHTK